MTQILVACASMAGRKRQNQDTVLACSLRLSAMASQAAMPLTTNASSSLLLAGVADGVSVCRDPKRASVLATEQFTQHLTQVLHAELAELLQTEASPLQNELPRKQAGTDVKDSINVNTNFNTKATDAIDVINATSKQTTATANHLYSLVDNLDDSDLNDAIAHAIANAMQSANDRLYFAEDMTDASSSHLPALLSTLSGVLVSRQTVHLWHTGDSRIYRYCAQSDNTYALKQLSRDHRQHKGRDKGALTSALGAGAVVDMQYDSMPIVPKGMDSEVYLVMTDGVYEHISDTEMQVLLEWMYSSVPTTATAQSPPHHSSKQYKLNELCTKLCQSALENGSRDNLSCVAVWLNQTTQSDPIQRMSASTEQSPVPSPAPCSEQHLTTTTAKITSLRIPEALRVGQTFEGFTVTQILQHSPRSSVYVVQDATQATYVLKAPSPYFADDGDFLRLFLKEQKIGLKFNHDSLLKFYPKPAGSAYLYHLTEYVQGISLRDYLDANAPLDLPTARALIERIGLALRVMHRNHMLHQDIKPENILLIAHAQTDAPSARNLNAYRIKLIDFGSVGSLILKHALAPPAGDLHYTAPEYYSDAPKGIHSEVFALGVLTYEMLTGTLPFDSKAIATAGRHGDGLDFISVQHRLVNAPFWLNAVLARAMHPNPRNRYVSIGEFISELDPDAHTGDGHKPPLMVRYPVRFWQTISGVLTVLLLLSVIGRFL